MLILIPFSKKYNSYLKGMNNRVKKKGNDDDLS